MEGIAQCLAEENPSRNIMVDVTVYLQGFAFLLQIFVCDIVTVHAWKTSGLLVLAGNQGSRFQSYVFLIECSEQFRTSCTSQNRSRSLLVEKWHGRTDEFEKYLNSITLWDVLYDHNNMDLFNSVSSKLSSCKGHDAWAASLTVRISKSLLSKCDFPTQWMSHFDQPNTVTKLT